MAKLLVLYANCILVKGAMRGAICDLQRGHIHLIPDSLYVLFDDRGCLNIAQLNSQLDDPEQQQILAEYETWLLAEELAFACTEAEVAHYPRLSGQWSFPALITNCIIDINEQTDITYLDAGLWTQLEKLCCNYIQLRFFDPVEKEYLEELMNGIKASQVKAVSLILAFKEEPGFFEWLKVLVEAHVKIQSVTVHACNGADLVLRQGPYIKTTDRKLNALHCGIVSADHFTVNIPAYTESLQHNTCLNRKISIDAAGYIRNCPSMTKSFGHIKDTTLAEALSQPGFKQYWHISKDRVKVCRDCEFRYVCTDCRAYVEEPDKDTSKPLKCGYDPYTATWQEWSSHPLKQKAIRYYGIPL